MQYLMKYEWVKLHRSLLPPGKGIMGAWARLAARAAYRKGEAEYCGHINAVMPGMWAGGVAGLKSILGQRKRANALMTIAKLSELGYLRYSLDGETKKLTYEITDCVVKCSGAECMDGAVYATTGYGFLCLPWNITQRLADRNYIFEEADAWLDLWCHTVAKEPGNAFSYLAPAIQYGRYGAVMTLEALGQRWGWEKTKVWRFFRKHEDDFALYRLPGSCGCLIYNRRYPCGTEAANMPRSEDVLRVYRDIRAMDASGRRFSTANQELNREIVLHSRRLVARSTRKPEENSRKIRVAFSFPIYRAYISPCWNCKYCWNSKYDCRVPSIYRPTGKNRIRGSDGPVDLNRLGKDLFSIGQGAV